MNLTLLVKSATSALIAATAITLLLDSVSNADWQDDFESPRVSWNLVEKDSQNVTVLKHERVFNQSHSGQGCEHIHIAAYNATKVYFGTKTPQAPIIDELSVSVWVKSNQPDIQLFARVLLPRTKDRNGKPRRVQLVGSTYDDPGHWQQLSVAQLERQMKQRHASWVSQFGEVDIREARIEMLLLNVYGNHAGETKVWIDDVELSSHVITSGENSVVDFQQVAMSDVTVSDSRFMTEQRPTFLRIIEHNGEPMAWLKQLGFNTISLPEPPTAADLEQAQNAGVWLIAPPPVNAMDARQLGHTPLLAWDCGHQLTSDSLDQIRSTALELRSPNEQLPLLACAPRENFGAYGRSMDFLFVDLPHLGSSHSLGSVADHLIARTDEAGFSGPSVAAVETEPAEALEQQWQAMGFSNTDQITLEPEHTRALSILAATSGARGVLFRSRTRLDADTTAARLRAATLNLANLDMQLIEPWTCGGRAMGKVNVEDVDRTDDPLQPGLKASSALAQRARIQGYEVSTQHAQLLVLHRTSTDEQHVTSAYVDEPLAIVAPTSHSSTNAYSLCTGGMQPLSTRRVAGGLRIQLEHLGPVGLIVVTNEGIVCDRMGKAIAQMRDARTALEQKILTLNMELTEQVQRELQPSRAARQPLTECATHLQRSGILAAGQDFRGFEISIDRGANALAALRRQVWEQAARQFTSASASPCCALYGSLPFHWQLAQQLRGREWSGNAVSAGEMEDLEHLLTSGWRRATNCGPNETCDAQISYDSPHSGRSSLLMSLEVPNAENYHAHYPGDAPLVISTAPVSLQTGQIVQIRGWVRVKKAVPNQPSPLLIYDSLAGESLAEVVDDAETWQQWTMYRAAPAPSQLVVNFALAAPGQVWLDDVSVQYVESP